MSSSPVKKVATKAVSETAKRIVPTRVRGWIENLAGAYGPAVTNRNLPMTGVPAQSIKKTNEDKSMVMVSKPVNVHVRGTVSLDEDRVVINLNPEYPGILAEVEEQFISGVAEKQTLSLEGKALITTHYGEKLMRLKAKHFKGAYVRRFKDEAASDTKLQDLDGKAADIIVRFYGMYITDDCYGPLVSVSAYNLISA